MIEEAILLGIFEILEQTPGAGFKKVRQTVKDKLRTKLKEIIRKAMKERPESTYTSTVREAFQGLAECDAKDIIYEMCEIIDSFKDDRKQMDFLCEQADNLRQALRRYGRHTEECNRPTRLAAPCSCDFMKALEL